VKLHRFLVETPGTFTPEQEHQLSHVLRLRSGDRVLVFDGRASRDLLLEATADGWRVVGECAQAAEPRTRLIAYPALLQRDKYETILQKLTELGVAVVVPLLTERALIRTAPDARRVQRWQSILREATEQCGRGRVPILQSARRFEHALAEADGAVLVAHQNSRERDLRMALVDRPVMVSLFTGPEGGFSDGEIAAATHARMVTLGPRILRAETAAPVLAALVLYELGDLSSSHV
jgi:16S rRNA (uracil1498-N3)-methyltransferase